MSERLIKPYEISVWEDKLTQNGFIENKLAVIGSDTMTGLNKVYDPVFNKKSNGEKTLSFSLKYKYFDPYSGNSDYVNPFATLLTNERKIKLHYDDQWYEFIIKEHTESSDELTWTYNCTDAFVLELSKNGYNITFDAELNNNQGTAQELAEKTLKDTDWQLGGASVGRQLVSEPIYKATLLSTTGIEIINTDNTTETVSSGTAIYLFYSYVKNKNGKYIQFIIQDNNRQYTIDDNNVITDTNFRIINELEYKDDGFYKDNNQIISFGEIETKYQANRLVYGQRTTYDPIKQRTVNIFKANDREIYKYTDYSYTTSNIVMNYITNGDNFNVLEDGTLQGWNPYVDFTKQSDDDKIDKLELVTYPELGTGKELADITALSQVEGFLKARFKGALTSDYKNAIYNSGIENNASFVDSISLGQEFIFRWRAGVRDSNETDDNKSDLECLIPYQNLRLLVAKYTRDDATRYGYYYRHIDPDNIILQFEGTPIELNNYIRGGSLVEITEYDETIDSQVGTGKYNYVIDNVVQTPSTKYIYVDINDNEYVWDGITGSFIEKTSDNYRPYYYLKAAATKAVTNNELKDTTQKIGIFIYTTDNTSPIYIQDIQLTRFIAEGETGDPILIGNTPVATTNSIDYYYLKPSEDTAAEDIQTYTTISDLAEVLEVQVEDIIPVYNEDSEKILTISASQSNCFNILQTIAETFECWIDLVVVHDARGYIERDEDGRPRKYVYLRQYAGKDNWAGFKYGINLQSIERTVNSDEIVTKLIVDLSQSDYTDEGFVSIANAPSNQSGESYIINFDYYYNQGLLDRDIAEADRLRFIEAVADKNNQLQLKEKERRDLEAALVSLSSDRNVFTELIDTAQDTQSQALEDFYSLTGQTYEDYKAEHTTLEEDDQLTEEDTIYGILGQLYISSATINNYAGVLTNKEQEYWRIRHQLRGSESYKVTFRKEEDINGQQHIIVELNDYLPGFQFTLGETYEETFTISKKYFDIESNETTISFSAIEGYNLEPNESSYLITSAPQIVKIVNVEDFDGVEDEIKQLQEEKEELVNNFNNTYRRFIQEGTWNSTDYIDSELYYLDALQVSNTSAQPTVSYTINVVEISELEGFEWYLFDAGDKTYVEDTEFFGWANVDGHLTPAREEVIVSEVEWHLDRPEENVITVQNYKTRFEDLFQRISAAVQTVQFNEATYAKISSLLDTNGSINQDVLLESLNRISGQNYNLTSDGSVLINGDQILVQNLTNPANRVIINSEGIRISSDGGQTWRTAINGQGINIGTVYTGTLNTDNVIIGSSDNPSFRWDRAGISAYKSNSETGIYDLKTYVRYDEYGLYGIKNNTTFKAQSLDDVLDKAHFAVTWDGFFIKNSYPHGGKVEITSDNDFRVLNTVQDQLNEKIKIGALEWTDLQGNIYTDPTTLPEAVKDAGPSLYGIRIKDDAGRVVMKTGDTGDLEITGTIYAEGGEIGGMVVNNDWLRMNYIVLEPGEGIYSTYPNIKGETPVDPSISAYPFWISDTDGSAIFNNVTVRGSIKTSVFEYEEIQAVGGAFMFRPSTAIREVTVNNNDLIIKVEKPLILRNGAWYKLSNYNSDESVGADDLTTYGLSHIYQLQITTINENTEDEYKEIRLLGAAAVLETIDINDIPGGSIIDMGYESSHDLYLNGINNYGIGINSSDNYINLPPRAISLFETVVDHTKNPKVSYKYKGILGTLPSRNLHNVQAGPLYEAYMEGTQGIYTNNMYIGDDKQYIAFYKDANGNSQLRLVAKSFEILPDDSDITIDLGHTIADQKIQYTLSTSTEENTLEEEWSNIPYEVTDGYYQWQRTYIKYSNGTVEYLPNINGNYISNEAGQPGPAGPPGPQGEDAVLLYIDSSNGNTFKNNSVSTVLTVSVFKGATVITNIQQLKDTFGNTAYIQWYWKRMNDNAFHEISVDDPMLSNAGFTLTLTPDKVDVKVVFQCEIKTVDD